jgi:ADP-heptose:LPS heptosyltransferase
MILRQREGYRPVEINVFFNGGGMGDNIASMTALKHLLDNYTYVTVYLFVFEYLIPLFTHVFSSYPKLKIYSWENDSQNANPRPTYYFYGTGNIQHAHTTLGAHLVDYPFSILLDKTPEPHERSYVKMEHEPLKDDKHVILTPGFTSKTRELAGKEWNLIAKGIIDRGLTPVWLGKKEVRDGTKIDFDEDIDFSLGIDMRDKTDLISAAKLMGSSRAVIGLDNGLIHLAALTSVPLVIAYTSVAPRVRIPVRDGIQGKDCVVIEPTGCRGCETKVRFQYDVDFRICYFADYACTKEITAKKMLQGLDYFLDLRNV